MPFIAFFRASECELGLLVFVLGVGRAPEPPHRVRGRLGVPLAFCATLMHPFRSEGGVVCRALECEPGSLGPSKVVGRAPETPHGARGRSGVPLTFYVTLAHPFRSEGGVVCRALECEPGSLGLGKVVGRDPSLCTEREGDQEFPWLFVRPSRILFVRKEG